MPCALLSTREGFPWQASCWAQGKDFSHQSVLFPAWGKGIPKRPGSLVERLPRAPGSALENPLCSLPKAERTPWLRVGISLALSSTRKEESPACLPLCETEISTLPPPLLLSSGCWGAKGRESVKLLTNVEFRELPCWVSSSSVSWCDTFYPYWQPVFCTCSCAQDMMFLGQRKKPMAWLM